MRKLLNKPAFVIPLALAAVVLCALSLRDQLGGDQFAGGPVAITPSMDAAADEESSSDEALLENVTPVDRTIAEILAALQFPATIPDPFSRRPAALVAGEATQEAAPAVPDFKDTIHLTAVWKQGDVRLALINDQIVRVGDRMGRLTIEAIGVDGVWVSHWRGRDFVAFGADFTLLTPAAGASTVVLHES